MATNHRILKYEKEAEDLLKKLIRIPSYSYEENERADFLTGYLKEKSKLSGAGFSVERIKNNILLIPQPYDGNKQTLMLNSHIDTVKEGSDYTFDPFCAEEKEGRIIGLGSNDDGASVVSQIAAFLYLATEKTEDGKKFLLEKFNVNLKLLLTCEEEKSGPDGMAYMADNVKPFADFVIIGEPTGMKAAYAEHGLLVLDGVATGKSGHAARNEGINALYIALDDINTLRNFKFEKQSEFLGELKITVTQINAGTAHNVVPDKCSFVVDVRPTEVYTNEEILDILQKSVKSKLTPRSLVHRSSSTPQGHRLLQCMEELGIDRYVSPTTSDWMCLHIPAIKIGPGESSRSHKADEFIKIEEIENGIETYIRIIENL
ncbi:MAG: M20/M25/M40 family metallo-hydrolase [Bacteroidales bacterium]|jgi:acetylornithine deacetylase|nr:M20/M25/M40 family metallo-hydrolase [Bacteroidales bacterium]